LIDTDYVVSQEYVSRVGVNLVSYVEGRVTGNWTKVSNLLTSSSVLIKY